MKNITYFKQAFIAALVAVFMAPAASFAGVLVTSGFADFDFSTVNAGEGTSRLNWSVYAGQGTATTITDAGGNSASVTTSDYIYLYTVNGLTSSAGDGITNLGIELDVSPTITAYAAVGGTAPDAADPSVPVSGSAPWVVAGLNAVYGSPGLQSGVSSFYWTSAATPGLTTATSQLTLKDGFFNRVVQSASIEMVTPGGATPLPGVPEPETWALLIMLSGFTMWWMRRRQDEDVVEESFTA